jgi:LPS sulfotransferase NodH
MANRFEYFVVLAGMRTGSNALEEFLNGFVGITCHGEVFNPHFIGHSKKQSLFDWSLDMRNKDPVGMIDTLRCNTEGLAGFRLFPDHDPRVLDHCLKDRRCAKVILTRSPVESYVSLKIARKTGQWWLGDAKSAKNAKADFDAAEFDAYLDDHISHQADIQKRLQHSGQTSFHVAYTDLSDDEAIAGLVRYLGGSGEQTRKGPVGRVQNPKPLEDKVKNYPAMVKALSKIDAFEIDGIPNFEPPRGPNVRSHVISKSVPVHYMPIQGGPSEVIRNWMGDVSGGADQLQDGLKQKDLRQWRRAHPGHVGFTIVSHPLWRAHNAFCQHIIGTGDGAYPGIAAALSSSYDIPIPENPDIDYDLKAHKQAFLAFLNFLKPNLGGQTSVRIDASWASQNTLVQGLSGFAAPDLILRLDRLEDDIAMLERRLGLDVGIPPEEPKARFDIADFYDDDIEKAARAAYQKDYMVFGYRAYLPS